MNVQQFIANNLTVAKAEELLDSVSWYIRERDERITEVINVELVDGILHYTTVDDDYNETDMAVLESGEVVFY